MTLRLRIVLFPRKSPVAIHYEGDVAWDVARAQHVSTKPMNERLVVLANPRHVSRFPNRKFFLQHNNK